MMRKYVVGFIGNYVYFPFIIILVRGEIRMIDSVLLTQRLLWVQLLLTLTSGILYSYNSAFSLLFYATDIVCLLNIVIDIHMKGIKIVLYKNNIGITFSFLFCIYAAISFFWSNFDWYNAFIRYRYILIAIITLDITFRYINDLAYSKMIDLMTGLMYVNLVFCAYQNLIMDFHPDFCNGIFGFTGYSNGIEGMFCLIMAILAMVYYIDNIWSAVRSGCMLLATCIICALAEIKLFFVLLVVSMVLIVLFKAFRGHDYKKIKRILAIIVAIIAVLYVAYRILTIIMPENLRVFQNLTNAIIYEERTTYAGRLNAISFISEHQFNNNIVRCFFGDGLGTSAFHYIYELGKVFSEQGYLGLFLVTATFLGAGVQNIFKKEMSSMKVFNMVYGMMMLISIFVWNVTFTRAAGLVFMVLGFQNVNYINRKERRRLNGQKV